MKTRIEMAYCALHKATFSDIEDCPHCEQDRLNENDFSDDFDDFEDDEEYFDCGAMSDMEHRLVGCQKAGSEECDWECPYRESVERSLRAQQGWETRRKKRVNQEQAPKQS